MPIAVRHSITYQYINPLFKWVASPEDAHDFVDTVLAEKFCAERHLSDAEIIIILRDRSRLLFRIQIE